MRQIPRILRADTPEAHIRSQGPQQIQPHKAKGEIGKISAGFPIMPKSPH